ncbi:peroxiredoxin [Wenyingzhuangia heitensis]|uniref:thioredoxin-dependent peroxiredoxin n=1 Tax=Wenyingzhuangia heitensis TaxID=1487859 RepID=A0ABX0UBE1_9FLAO|nr:peroxiredoxin-like family protein [Wenyingzhuangia heitensis]NIJ46138.1 peroxiredoxin [Wenyingzhuangia heitensis]
MNLTEQLANKKQESASKIPQEIYAKMSKATQDLIDKNISNNTPKKGDKITDFKLPNSNGTTVHLSEILSKGKAVISFYRGGWCPYCNLELKALNNILPKLKELGTNLVAITPETPDNSLTTSEKNNLEFDVLTDYNNKYAKELNLVFQLSDEIKNIYNSFNLDIKQHNGNDDYELPMPATFIVDTTGIILYAFVPEDYTTRLDPDEILEILKK